MFRLAALLVLLTPPLFVGLGAQGDAPPAKPPLVEQYLIDGNLADGEKALIAHLETSPRDEEARFGLGILQFLRGVERFGQSLYKYQPRTDGALNGLIPFLRMPVPKNPNPEAVSYAKFRSILEALHGDLQKTESTLAAIKNPRGVKLPLHFGLIRLDFNGDGKLTEDEALWHIYARFNGGLRIEQQHATKFVIGFDEADVSWLRGYCHLLMAMDEMALAHSFKDVFERAGHLIFPKVDSPYSYLKRDAAPGNFGGSNTEIADIIAFIHCLNFPVEDPAKMKSALAHLKEVISLSRTTWKAIEAEDDDDREWIPSPRQTGVIPGVRVTKEMVAGWHDFLDEADAIFAGKKLVPHWRVSDGRGINLRKVFEEPRAFDIVLWVQGSGPEPFLEQGTLTQPEFWRRMERIFGGQFIGFAAWFN